MVQQEEVGVRESLEPFRVVIAVRIPRCELTDGWGKREGDDTA